jgi:microcystin degradation protein MlrC
VDILRRLSLRFGYGKLIHKSNSFALTATTLEDFQNHECITGEEIVERYSSTGTILGGVIRCATTRGDEAVPLLAVSAPAGGPVEPEAIAKLANVLIRQCVHSDASLDGVILELSGTMTTIDGRSGDEIVMDALRAVMPEKPIIAVLSPQANLTERLVDSCTAIVGTRTVPSTDYQHAASDAVTRLTMVHDGQNVSHCHVEKLPLLVPIAAQGADKEPLRDIYQALDEWNDEHSPNSIHFFTGFPYTDAAHAGSSILVNNSRGVCTDNGSSITDQVRQLGKTFYVEGSNVEEAVHHAMASRTGPTLIADLGDNPDDGAPGDGTTVLWALIDLGVRNATVAAIADEQAVEACVRAGTEAKIEIPVGGRKDTRHGYPIDVCGRVTSIHDGTFQLSGPLTYGTRVDAGRIVVLDVEARHEGHVELILTEKPIQITDTSFFEHIGIKLEERSIVSIKSAIDYRTAFESITSEIFEVITPGITTPDPAFYAYQNVRRPIHPLDPID